MRRLTALPLAPLPPTLSSLPQHCQSERSLASAPRPMPRLSHCLCPPSPPLSPGGGAPRGRAAAAAPRAPQGRHARIPAAPPAHPRRLPGEEGGKGGEARHPLHHPLIIPVDCQFTGQPVLIGGTMGTCSYVLTGAWLRGGKGWGGVGGAGKRGRALTFPPSIALTPPTPPHRHGEGHDGDVRQHVPRRRARVVAVQGAAYAHVRVRA